MHALIHYFYKYNKIKNCGGNETFVLAEVKFYSYEK